MTSTDPGQQIKVVDAEEEIEVSLAVENYRPDDVSVTYADATTVLHSGNEFVLSFLLTEFPLAINNQELAKLSGIRRKCVAQIIVSPAHFRSIVQSLQKQLDKFNASQVPKEAE